jgi:hypothetical protein
VEAVTRRREVSSSETLERGTEMVRNPTTRAVAHCGLAAGVIDVKQSLVAKHAPGVKVCALDSVTLW